MGIGVIVHGFIESTGWGGQVESRRIYRHNRSVIKALPQTDDTWPFFTRSAFSVLPLRNNLEVKIPQYESLIIAFGASYKNMYCLDSAWIRKFERLLSRLCWRRASIFVEFTALRYDWEVPSDQHTKNFFADPPKPPSSWKLECRRMSALAVSLQDNIEGDAYVPIFEGVGPVPD
jgi:hypothetical protein